MWVWAGSRSWWWTRKPSMLQSMGSQRVRHDWAIELNWEMHQSFPSLFIWPTSANWLWFQPHFLESQKGECFLAILAFLSLYMKSWFPGWLRSKESVCQCRRCGFNPWVEKIPWRRKQQPTPYSCLGNPMDRGAWWATVQGVAKKDHNNRLDNLKQ